MNNRLLRVGLGVIALVLGVVAVSLYFSQRALEREQQLAAAGQLEEAIQKANLAARLNPFATEPLEARSIILLRQNRDEEAEEALKKATEREPANYQPYMLLGRVQLSALNRPEAAVGSYQKALERNPRNDSIVGGLADALFNAGKLEAAAGRYEKLRRNENISTGALYNLGRIYVHTGRPAKGLKTLKAAEKRAKRQIAGSEGQQKERLEGLETSIELAIADAYVVQGRYGEARQVLAGSSSDQASAILRLLNSNPQGYRQSVLENEIYR